ncbi:uncharacterized protein LOC129959628 [Argiope bruennichi]|uniref:uncharacterized protein LOC129959628 n=1 Tax=Argiope bruennichi TaxID=94029 RepID=UPI0024941350|nr:uncharacterized protein LOC129959628 [Argiope bruennichi]
MEYDGIYGPTVKTGPYVRKSFAMEEKQPNDNPKKLNRKNPWGSRSYADLITQAIEASPEKRLTLSQIYEWMIRNIPFFSDQAESNSSAGWKNSIRHNLSLHKKFMRIRNDGTGKSSWWTVDEAAGSGRTPRRKGTYRRRKGRGMVSHNPVENRRRSLFPNGIPQRNLWLRKSDVCSWNNSQYANDENQANSNPPKPFNSGENLPSFSALYNDRSWKTNFHLSTGTPYHSEQLFIAQTSSLKTETSSYGSCHSSYQAYHQQQVIFHKASFKPIGNKTVSTEYFMSPHHLSGSYITTEVGRNKIDLDNGNFLNTSSETYCLPPSEDEVIRQILQQDESDTSNEEIDFLLNKEIQDNAVDLRAILDELSELKNCDSNYRNVHNSVLNQLTSIDLKDTQNANPMGKRQSGIFDELDKELENNINSSHFNLSNQRKIMHSDETENTSITFRNSDLYDRNFKLNHTNEGNLFSFSEENKSEDVSIPLNVQNMASHQSDSNVIEEIIQKLTSPCSDTVDSFSETADTPNYQLSSPSPETITHSEDENGNAKIFAFSGNRTNLLLNLSEISSDLCQDANQPPQLEFPQVYNSVDIGSKTSITNNTSKRQAVISHQPNSSCLEQIIQRLSSSREYQNDSTDETRKISENQRHSFNSESSSSSIHENQNINHFPSQEFQKNEACHVDEVFMDTELSKTQSSEMVFIKNVSDNSEIKTENFISNMLEESSTKFQPDSVMLTPHDVDAYFSSCQKFKSAKIARNRITNDQNFKEGERQCLKFYSDDIKRDKLSMENQNIPESLLQIFLNADGHSENMESSNLSQNSFSHKTMNGNSDTIADVSSFTDFLNPTLKSELSTFNSLSDKTSYKSQDDIFPLREINNSFFLEKFKIGEVPPLGEEDNTAKGNFLHRDGAQNIEDSTYDMDQSSSDIEICEKLKKSSIGSSSNISSGFCSALDSFDEYDDPHMRRENGDPCLLSESSNSYQGFEIDLPLLKFDDNAKDENFNLDYSCNQPESLCAIDDCLFEYIRNGILQEDNKFFDSFNSVASHSEADSKDINFS